MLLFPVDRHSKGRSDTELLVQLTVVLFVLAFIQRQSIYIVDLLKGSMYFLEDFFLRN